MSTKISALTAAVAGNVTDATVLPLVDATTTTVKVTVAQLRTQIMISVPTVVIDHPSDAIATFIADNGALNEKRWSWVNSAGALSLVAYTDAQTSPVQALAFTRTGTTVTGISLKALVTIPSTVTSAAGSGTDIVLGATTQSTIGANGAASALTANPLGYLVFYKGATKCVLPYYNG